MDIDFTNILQKRHEWALRHKESGGLVIGCYSALIPEEIMWACGVLPVQLFMSPGNYVKAQEYLPPYLCDCSKSLLEQFLDGTYSYLDGLIVAHVCETVRGLTGIWSLHFPDRFVHVFTPPVNSNTAGRKYLKAEFIALSERLSQRGARPLSEDSLREAISVYNSNRRLIRELYEARGNCPSAVSPKQVLSAVLAGLSMPKPLHNEILREFLKTVKPKTQGIGTRILLSGLTFENQTYGDNGLLSILSDSSVLVCWDDLASGVRYRLAEVEEHQGSTNLDMLVESFLGPQPAPTRCPVERKAGELLQAAHMYRAQGVIFLVPKYCDPMLFDIPSLIHIMRGNGYPSLVIEVSGKLSEGQLRTRVEAFLEVLSDRVGESPWS